jgi:uncharacterized protein (DUF427 family)
MKAVWQETILAQSDQTISVEGNHYFPPNSIHKEYFDQSETHSTCPWKGTASYYHLELVNRVTPLPPGTILSRRTLPNRSKGTSPSGAG